MSAGRKRINFTIVAPHAETVYLAGTFNEWSNQADPMKKDREGFWRKIKVLGPGEYQYKFIVDGNWIIDPTTQNTVADSSGALNHTLQV